MACTGGKVDIMLTSELRHDRGIVFVEIISAVLAILLGISFVIYVAAYK